MAQQKRLVALVGWMGLLASFAGCSGGSIGGGGRGCDYDGKHYSSGDSFADAAGCNQCGCNEDGDVVCTDKACPPNRECTYGGKRYDPGATFSSADGCNQCTCQTDGSVDCTERDCDFSCESLEAEREKELAQVQRCSTAADCGQQIPRSSCGCTRDLVARKDANLDRYLELQQMAAEQCGAGGSTCDCPAADGFACVSERCTWNFTGTEPEPDPVCQKVEGRRLCVRGTATAGGEVLSVGDTLTVTVQSDGCFSSSCSKVHTADCAITEGVGFNVAASFCIANTSAPGQACTDDCGNASANCSFSQGLSAGEHQVRLGSVVVGFQVPTKLPLGGLCADSEI